MEMFVKPTSVLGDMRKMHKEARVDFDPANPEHREDFVRMEFGKPTKGRYNLTSKQYRRQLMYTSVLVMMKTEMSLWACGVNETWQVNN